MSPVLPSIGTKLGSGWGALLKSMPLEDGSFADVLADQVRFRITQAGATSIEHVLPDSARARELWKLDSTKQFAQGVLDLANDVSGNSTSPLRGFTLSTSEAGFLANRAVHHFRPGVAPTRAAYDAGIEASRAHLTGTVAVRKGAWLHLGPLRSEGLLHALEHPGTPRGDLSARMRTSTGRGVKTLLHELNHVGSGAPSDWVSEGKAEALARWPGRVPAAGRALGIDVPSGVGRWADETGPYQEEVASVRALLRMAGIDPTKASHYERARALLNDTPADKLAGELASRIARRHGETAAERNELRRTVRQLVEHGIAPDGEHADPAAVRRLARSLEWSRDDGGVRAIRAR
jgi:hypothetical protein